MSSCAWGYLAYFLRIVWNSCQNDNATNLCRLYQLFPRELIKSSATWHPKFTLKQDRICLFYRQPLSFGRKKRCNFCINLETVPQFVYLLECKTEHRFQFSTIRLKCPTHCFWRGQGAKSVCWLCQNLTAVCTEQESEMQTGQNYGTKNAISTLSVIYISSMTDCVSKNEKAMNKHRAYSSNLR